MQKEIWKDVNHFEGKYQVSNLGRVKKLKHSYVDTYKTGRYRTIPERILKQTLLKSGYFTVCLSMNNNRKWCYVHRLVAEAFISNPNNYSCVNHKDENKCNNHVDNLEWCTNEYNLNYGNASHKRVQNRKDNGNYVVTDEQRKKISRALLGKKKTIEHCKHISDGRKRMFAYNQYCKEDN